MDDLISRQAAIDALNKQIQQCRKALGSLSLSDVDKHAVEVKMASLRAYKKMLENLPTIQPEPQEGHWIGSDGSYICSECNGSPIDFIETMGDSFDAYMETPMPYCPNCGVKMTISK